MFNSIAIHFFIRVCFRLQLLLLKKRLKDIAMFFQTYGVKRGVFRTNDKTWRNTCNNGINDIWLLRVCRSRTALLAAHQFVKSLEKKIVNNFKVCRVICCCFVYVSPLTFLRWRFLCKKYTFLLPSFCLKDRLLDDGSKTVMI